jgi:hypothetical protein
MYLAYRQRVGFCGQPFLHCGLVAVPVSKMAKAIIVRKKLDWANSCDCNLQTSENITQTIQPVS